MFPDHETHPMDDFFSFGDTSPDYNGDEGDGVFRSMTIDDNSKTPYSDATQVNKKSLNIF